jgi:hypothetical protein
MRVPKATRPARKTEVDLPAVPLLLGLELGAVELAVLLCETGTLTNPLEIGAMEDGEAERDMMDEAGAEDTGATDEGTIEEGAAPEPDGGAGLAPPSAWEVSPFP